MRNFKRFDWIKLELSFQKLCLWLAAIVLLVLLIDMSFDRNECEEACLEQGYEYFRFRPGHSGRMGYTEPACFCLTHIEKLDDARGEQIY